MSIIFICKDGNVTYFDKFGAEYIPKEIKKFRVSRNITANTYRMEAYD